MDLRFQNSLAQREKRLQQLSGMTKKQLEDLLLELHQEHQQLVNAEASAKNAEESKQYHQLCFKNEQQTVKVNKQLDDTYQQNAAFAEPKAPVVKNVLRAFVVGGLICTWGQLVIYFMMHNYGMEAKDAAGIASVTIIIMTAILTGIGIYDEIGRFGGAGSMVPISGFANSIVSAALEFKREGLVYGIGAKIFTIAGPVILYGTMTSIVVGLIYYFMGAM